MKIEQFHEWIWDWNRFDVTAYNISTCFWPGGSSADVWPFIAKNTDFSFLIFHCWRSYDYESDTYSYKYIKSIDTYSEWVIVISEKVYDYLYETRDKIKILQEIFIKKI